MYELTYQFLQRERQSRTLNWLRCLLQWTPSLAAPHSETLQLQGIDSQLQDKGERIGVYRGK